jgi:putative aminopeptidase FrvX
MKKLLENLLALPAPSGREDEVRLAVRLAVEPLADEVHVDNLGNLIARLGNAASGLKIMLAAHMDEIGLIASHIDEHGFVRVQPLGGVRPGTCLGGRVRFLNGAMGVIGADRSPDTGKTLTIEGLFIDLGASSRSDCPVGVGDMAVFERPFAELGKRLVSKALDDRLGVAILIEAMRQLKELDLPHQLYFVFSVQEEVGRRGAAAAAFGIDPHLGLAVDITGSGDTPHGSKMEIGLGKGPAITVRDKGLIADPRLVDWMVNTAVQSGIPYQLEVFERGATDASVIQLTRAGVPAGSLSIPCRYVHSPSEMVDYDDVQNALRLLVELLSKPAPFNP